MSHTIRAVGEAKSVPRRRVLAIAGTWMLAGPLTSPATSQPAAESTTGWVLPRRPAPTMALTGTDGRITTLPAALTGKVSAVQLMFTGCGTTCPTQGALFAAVADSLRTSDIQLLSISIDVLGDTPARLREWQGRFGKHPSWRAALADSLQVDRLAEFMKGASANPGTHTAQVFVFDRSAQLCYRSADSPLLGDVQALLAHVRTAG